MTIKCEWCKTEFSSGQANRRYCSRDCARMARRAETFHKREAEAKELGMSLEEYAAYRRRLYNEAPRRKSKSYAQIKRANRARRVEAGWRGQVVLGGWGS